MMYMQTPLRILILVAICGLASSAFAARVDNLYATEVPFTSGQQDLQAAFISALEQVLVKTTGRTDIIRDEGIRARFSDPDRFVQQYRIQPDGEIWVRFDEIALKRELDAAGAPVWGSERPQTLIWLLMDYGLGQLEVVSRGPVTADSGREPVAATTPMLNAAGVRDALLGAAADRGLPIVLPEMDISEQMSVSTADVWSGVTESLVGVSRRYAPDAIMVGRGHLAADGQAEVNWTLLLDVDRFDWNSDVVSGPNELADFFAARLATSSGSSRQLTISIEGVESLNDYGRLSDYLSGLDNVDQYSVDQVSGQQILFTLQMRGDADQLVRSIALQRVLRPISGPLGPRAGSLDGGADAGIPTLHYRLSAGP